MDRRAAAFEALVAARVRDDPNALIYGVTSAPGDRATAVLDPDGQATRPSRLWTATSYGDPLPVRVVRAIALARLANFLGDTRLCGQTSQPRSSTCSTAGRYLRCPRSPTAGRGNLAARRSLLRPQRAHDALTQRVDGTDQWVTVCGRAPRRHRARGTVAPRHGRAGVCTRGACHRRAAGALRARARRTRDRRGKGRGGSARRHRPCRPSYGSGAPRSKPEKP